jgi:hypothetical protein
VNHRRSSSKDTKLLHTKSVGSMFNKKDKQWYFLYYAEMQRFRSIEFRFRKRYLNFTTIKWTIVHLGYRIKAVLYVCELHQSHVFLRTSREYLNSFNNTKLLKNFKKDILPTGLSSNWRDMQCLTWRVDWYWLGVGESKKCVKYLSKERSKYVT